jgi:hypothetical protein
VAHFDALAPLRVQHLVGADTSGRVGVEYAVDDIAATGLEDNVSMCSLGETG